MTVDEKQLTNADALVEAKFLARFIKSADDLDGEIGAAIPMCFSIFGRISGKEHGHVRTPVIALPAFRLVADVAAVEDLARRDIAPGLL